MQRIGFRHQRTLRTAASVRGVGIVAGSRVCLRFLPAPENTGLVFVRTDLPYRPMTPARADRVTGTNRRTTLGTAETGVTLVEHVLAALSGLRIDNCRIELDAAEPPGLDGSAAGFVEALRHAGTVLQADRRPVWSPNSPIVLAQGGATIALYPNADAQAGCRVSYTLDYGLRSPIERQTFTTAVTPAAFARDVSHCRTFLLEHETDALRRQGVGRHLTASELLVFGPRGVIDNTLRHADEPARHKVLDLIGDLALCGVDVSGHIVAYRSGHSLNVALARAVGERVARATVQDDDAPDTEGVILPTRGFLPRRHRRQEAA